MCGAKRLKILTRCDRVTVWGTLTNCATVGALKDFTLRHFATRQFRYETCVSLGPSVKASQLQYGTCLVAQVD